MRPLFVAALVCLSAVTRVCVAAAGVPEVAEPPVDEFKCHPSKTPSCPPSGIQRTVLPRPFGDRCASVPLPVSVSVNAPLKPVVLKVYSFESGDIAGVEVIQSSGIPLLDDAAYDAALNCRFHVGTVNGAPAKTIVKMRYVWDPNASPSDPPEQVAARASRPLGNLILMNKEPDPPKDLVCSEPKVTPPATVFSGATPGRPIKAFVAARVSAPDARVSFVIAGPRPGIEPLYDLLVTEYQQMHCTVARPMTRGVWVFRNLVFNP
jgi:TonB family protein